MKRLLSGKKQDDDDESWHPIEPIGSIFGPEYYEELAARSLTEEGRRNFMRIADRVRRQGIEVRWREVR